MDSRQVCAAIASALAVFFAGTTRANPPEVLNDRYELSLFAETPEIVTPIGATFDRSGRLLVIESHTHFRPKDYDGPPRDRIRVLEDTDGDGRADRFTTFHEGLTHAMALATGPNGSIYVATRARILRLHDADKDGVADPDGAFEIARLETPGKYPHNGLCGLVFDRQSRLWFGLGENLGEPYKLIGSDRTVLVGGGEGGNIYACEADGSRLKRIATGFWNPFGLCFDSRGRLFCVDNDPDRTPYCRLLHIVPGADFGYQYRYGRSGVHPLQAWDGELPGTLPMVAPTGEAPCAVMPFDGRLWVTSWHANRLERYALKPEGASWKSRLEIMVQGDKWFWPVDLAPAPDGSLYFTDWGSASYELHNLGRVWRLALKKGQKPVPVSEWPSWTEGEIDAALRRQKPALRQLATDDRFLWQATVAGLIEHGLPDDLDWEALTDPRARLGVLAAARWSGKAEHRKFLSYALGDESPEVKLLAVRWVADQKLKDHRPELEQIARDAKPVTPLGKGVRAALDHLKH